MRTTRGRRPIDGKASGGDRRETGWKLDAHTADVILELTAPDPSRLAEAAAKGVCHTVIGSGDVRPSEERWIDAANTADRGERFFRFVRELFFLVDTDRFVPVTAQEEDDGWRVAGEVFDPERHEPRYQVKAVTRHRWIYECDERGCRARMVLDL